MHQAAFHPAFKRDIKNLPMQLLDKLNKSFDEVLINPFRFDRLKGELREISKTKIRHLGVEYRLAFYVQKEIVVFLMFSKRENFYDYLRRRMR
ncbi:MAG: type II toxin-antitoxin system RelE/ParE family toxin [Bacteroidota bacterium]|nr:type II toxin-antitoxin system RelE/ParE family toxin [Patescibacteria group bacterium]